MGLPSGPFGASPFSAGGETGAPSTGGLTGPQAGIGGAGLLKSFGDIVSGFQSSANYGAQQNAELGNAAFDRAAGKSAFMSAANRAAMVARSGSEDVGREAAAIGQSGVGISSSSAQSDIRQSETNARMDFLNTTYGGKVQKYGYDTQALQQDYAAKVSGLNKQNAMYGGFLSAGTDALTTVATMAAL